MTLFRIVSLLCATAVMACTPAARAPGAATERAVVVVDNQRLSDVNVFVLNGGQRVRLGRVGAKRTAQFNIPAGVVSRAREVEFLAESMSGGAQAVSQRIWVAPGERVRLLLQ